MRRRPEEDDREKRDALERDRIGYAGPADNRRECACGAADDDVLRRRALQPHRVDDRIEENGEGEQAGRKPVDDQAEGRHREHRQEQAEGKRGFRRNPARGNRPFRGPAHHQVDVGVVPHVERAGRATANRDRKNGNEADHRMDLAGSHQHANQRGEDHQRHDTRFQQREEIARIAVDTSSRSGSGQSIMFVDHCHGQLAFPSSPGSTGPFVGDRTLPPGCKHQTAGSTRRPGFHADCAKIT